MVSVFLQTHDRFDADMADNSSDSTVSNADSGKGASEEGGENNQSGKHNDTLLIIL